MARGLSRSSARPVPAVERAIGLLTALGRARQEPRLSDLSHRLRLHKSTAYNILRTLEAHRWVSRDPLTRRYRLGTGILALGRGMGDWLDLRAAARGALAALREATGETAALHMPDGAGAIIVDREESAHQLRVTAPVGHRLPPFAGAVAKVLLAALPDGEIQARLRAGSLPAFTPRSITVPDAYRREILRARRRGWAADDEEYMPGVRALSAPIRDGGGQVVAAITVIGSGARLSRADLPRVARRVVVAAAEVSRGLRDAGRSAS